ncbi:polysaccharide deacetylase family protein [Kibdelosporangium philippinense]|uniref:polysaccharide deacetylase family protein n=1 Tax=Kibdelosporangium philippinense TaxID=211113 RepID=UPI0035577B88
MLEVSRAARQAIAPVARRCGSVIGSLCEVRTAAPQVVLTYDDGPDPGGTEQVLAALADHGATATFFALLSRARRHPQLLAEVVAAGHEIGLHGVDHRRLTGFTPTEVQRRTRDAKAELEDLIGRGIRWFRPPYGKQTFGIWRAINRCGLVSVSWGRDMLDWQDVPQTQRVAAALKGGLPGTIVLAHDGFAGPDDGADDGPPPVFDRGELARLVLEAYGEQGLVGRSLADALIEGKQVRRPWFKH